MGNGKRGLDGRRCQGRRPGHHITALCGLKIRVGTVTVAVARLLVVKVVLTVVTGVAVVVVSFGELLAFTVVVTLAVVVVDTFGGA